MSLSFGQQASAGGGIGAKPATTSTIGFGALTAPVAPQPQGTSFGSTSTTGQPGTLFGAPQATTAAPLFSSTQPFGSLFSSTLTSTAPVSTSSGLFSGLGSAPKPGGLFSSVANPSTLGAAPSSSAASGLAFPAVCATSTPFNIGSVSKPFTVPSSTVAITSVGLGGIDTTSSSGGMAGLTGLSGSSNGRQEMKTVKENPIPNEVAQGIESFRECIKKQKSLSCEVARCSSKPLLKVEEDTEAIRQLLVSSTAGLQRCRSIADKLKADTAKGLQHCEMAQRTHDTPPGLQYDNTTPLQYFAGLVSGFEKDIQLFRQEIENAERHVHSRCQLTGLTPAELTQAMRRLYDSFVALAGRLHTIHSQVKSHKDQYLSLRRYILNDNTDVFDEAARAKVNETLGLKGSKSGQSSRSTAGPTPFSALNSQQGFGLLTAGTTASSRQSFAAVGPLGWSSAVNTTGSLSAPSQPLLLSPQPDSSQFQLQKPPTGNKRWKR